MEILSEVRIRGFLASGSAPELFVMFPYPDDFHCLDLSHHLIYQALLDVNSARVRAGKVTNEFFMYDTLLLLSNAFSYEITSSISGVTLDARINAIAIEGGGALVRLCSRLSRQRAHSSD